jgi:hypothetical protein
MGGNAIPICRPVTLDEAQSTISWFIDLLPLFGIREICPLGSLGKKKEGELYGDIDLAVDINDIIHFADIKEEEVPEYLSKKLESLGFKTKINHGFRIVSFASHINGNSFNWEYVQVDLMLAPNLEWAKFLYHSPDFTKNESQYKGYYRNILLMAIITETQKVITKTTPEGGIEEIEVNILRYPKGIWRVTKNFMGKKGLIKTGKNIGEEYLITDQFWQVVDKTVGICYTAEDIDTFEKLWNIVISSGFIWREKRTQIIKRFKECLVEQGLPEPKEVKEYESQIY